MSDVITFSIPGRAPAELSPNSRAHWTTKRGKKAEGQMYGAAVQAIAQTAKPAGFGSPWQRAHVTLVQRAVRLRDHDNWISSWKSGLDGCVRAGLIADDKPSVIDLTVKAEKVNHEADESVEVRIERRDG